MFVVITGATGHLGRLVVESLLQQGVPARDITAAGRDTTKIKDLADRGVRVQPVSYHDLPVAEYTQLLTSAGIPEPAAAILADADRGLARGDLYVDSGHLRQLTGWPTTSLHDAVAAALR